MTTGLRLLSALLLSASLLCTTILTTEVMAEEPPITVEADHMTSVEKESSVIFTGDVDARQANVRIRTDKMIVYYTEKAKGNKASEVKQKVEKMVCNGNVQITRDDWLGTSKDMVYLSKERQFILIGDAKAWQGKNMVSGDKIIYYLDEKRSEVVADSGAASTPKNSKNRDQGRVKMTIIQE